MLSQQIKNELPADLLLNIMQYACYKTHDNAKMIKELLKNWPHYPKNGAGRLMTVFVSLECGYDEPVEYIERDCAQMFKEVDYHSELIDGEVEVVDWFQQVTEQYADCSDEFRNNLIIYSEMISEVDQYRLVTWQKGHGRSDYWEGARQRAWGLYKIISDCPTSVY